MSLYKQLTILITIFLVLMSTVLLWFILSYNKNLIENQLGSNAKNSASFLGLSISRDVDFKDTSTMEGMINSIISYAYFNLLNQMHVASIILFCLSCKFSLVPATVFTILVC